MEFGIGFAIGAFCGAVITHILYYLGDANDREEKILNEKFNSPKEEE